MNSFIFIRQSYSHLIFHALVFIKLRYEFNSLIEYAIKVSYVQLYLNYKLKKIVMRLFQLQISKKYFGFLHKAREKIYRLPVAEGSKFSMPEIYKLSAITTWWEVVENGFFQQ